MVRWRNSIILFGGFYDTGLEARPTVNSLSCYHPYQPFAMPAVLGAVGVVAAHWQEAFDTLCLLRVSAYAVWQVRYYNDMYEFNLIESRWRKIVDSSACKVQCSHE